MAKVSAMNRRQLFLTAAAFAAVSVSPVLAATRTQWTVSLSEGFDALCFLGPLSGKDFYARYYKDELAQMGITDVKLQAHLITAMISWHFIINV